MNMSGFEVHDMDERSQYYVSTCSHCNESEETDFRARDRLSWLLKMKKKGLVTKVAVAGDKTVGFIHMEPIEISPWGIFGKYLWVIPCLDVNKDWRGKGLGKALISEVAKEAIERGAKGLVVLAYKGDFPFMPMEFFKEMGFREVARRKVISVGETGLLDDELLLVLPLEDNFQHPSFGEPDLDYSPKEDHVVVDLFYNPFCLTSVTEAERVREVASEFPGKVILREYPAHDREVLRKYQNPRGIFINGKEIGWGWTAPKDGIREAIMKEMEY